MLEELLSKVNNDVKDLLIFSDRRMRPWVPGWTTVLGAKEQKDNIDPSTIFVQASIKSVDDHKNLEKLPYNPAYVNISPQQRFAYLKWLQDVREPIQIGYVFMFYYGLERGLPYEDYEKYFSMIKFLREFHKNKSFLNYSRKSLIYSSIVYNRLDKLDTLQDILGDDTWGNESICLAYLTKKGINAENFLKIMRDVMKYKISFSRKKATLYLDELNRYIITKLKSDTIPLHELLHENHIKKTTTYIYANYSIHPERRSKTILYFCLDEYFLTLIKSIHLNITEKIN